MAEGLVPTSFDWVRGRAECSLYKVFKELLVGVREDVDTRNSIQPNHNPKWSVGALSSNRFSVLREENTNGCPVNSSVEFILAKDHLEIVDDDETSPVSNTSPRLVATITLNNEGLCRLKVGDVELEQWQLRRMALESIFFGSGRKAANRVVTLPTGSY
jgi:hypothetical protein